MTKQHRRAVLATAVCALTSAHPTRRTRAKAHLLGASALRTCVAIVLGMGILACEPPIDAEDAARLDASAAVVDAASDDAPSLDAGPTVDAPELDAMGRDAGAARGSLVSGVHDVLFVGNSYVFTGDVPGRCRALLGGAPSRIESVVAGGYRLTQHATDAQTDGTALATWLRTGTVEERAFDVVVLQEQSQIGGFPEGQVDRVASLEGASTLASLATANGASILLYVTWGREHGDEMNPGLFPDFSTMQDRLDAGYRAMAARLRGEGARVRLAPVGAAFRLVHDDLVAAGADPEAEGSTFDALYSPDGSHPSGDGAYLIALVIQASITGADPRAMPDALDLDPAASARYREVAARVMEDPAWESELR